MNTRQLPEAEAEAPRVHPARAFLLGSMVLLLVIDLLLAAHGRGAKAGAEALALTGPDRVRARLQAVSEAPEEQAWLLLGDSVLVGDSGRAQDPSWAQHRVLDYLRGELSVEASVHLDQVALDGMLPVDMLAVAAALDEQDPSGRVSLLVELSPRHFSPSYAEDPSFSRPWLAELAREGAWSLEGAMRRLRAAAPIYRHREDFAWVRELLAGPAEEALAREPGRVTKEAARVEGLARLSVHYRDPVLAADSVQVAALVELGRRCRARGRRLVLFTTPLEDRFIAGLDRSEAQGDTLGRLDALLEPDGRELALVPMDHPLFASAMFWDHVHLRPEGSRLLALNLLASLGLGLERSLGARELIGRPGVDASLVARVEAGSSDGAAWQARFDHPQGLALSEGGQRLVLADTNNHVLRQLHGDMRVVSTFAGAAGSPGEADGPTLEARLRRPSAPVFAGEQLYFADAEGSRLRRVVGGEVETLAELDAGWAITAMRAEEGRVWMLQARGEQSRVVVHEDGRERERVRGGVTPDTRIVALTLSPAGALYFATGSGRIHRVEVGELLARAQPLELALGIDQTALIYANEGEEVIPQEGRAFPRPFAEVRLSTITELIYVERYGGLLVQDLAPHARPGRYANPVTERAHLRFLDLERELVYVWVKPLVVGLGYAYENRNTGGLSSYFHAGSMALDPNTARLFYLEAERSRLLRLEDGMLGAAKTGSYRVKRFGFNQHLGGRTGVRSLADHEPLRFVEADARLDPQLGGPYQLLLVGSSMLSTSEHVGEYSLGRALIHALERELALRDRVRLHGFQRTVAGGRLSRQLPVIKAFLKQGGRPDLILIDANGSTFFDADADLQTMEEQLEQLVALARRWDSKLVFLDSSPYIVRNREPPRPAPAQVTRFLALARARGLDVIQVEDTMLDLNLEVAPMASPPVTNIHSPTWVIDALADVFAAQLSPLVRAWLRGREPASRAASPASPRVGEPLATAFAEVEFDWAAGLPALPTRAVQLANEGAQLVAFVDVAQLPEAELEGSERPLGEEELDALILACIYEQAVHQRDGARTAEITIARFARYDEYGAGVREGAQVLARAELDLASLRARVEAYAAR